MSAMAIPPQLAVGQPYRSQNILASARRSAGASYRAMNKRQLALITAAVALLLATMYSLLWSSSRAWTSPWPRTGGANFVLFSDGHVKATDPSLGEGEVSRSEASMAGEGGERENKGMEEGRKDEQEEDGSASAGAPIGEGFELGAKAMASMDSKCPPGCWDHGHGSCNEELGRCDCVTGFTGPSCGDLAMPACHLAPGYSAICQVPSSCACGLQCDRFRIPHKQPCFDERRGEGEEPETDVVALYKRPQVRMLTDLKGNETEERRPASEDEKLKDEYTHPAECPEMCHGRGACVASSKTCQCVWGWSGISCKDEVWSSLFHCMSNCSGHGDCLGFVCRCHRGYFGTDCSLFLGSDGKAQMVPRPPYLWTEAVPPMPLGSVAKPRIYVYELPGEFNTWQFDHWPHVDWPEERIFMERMLASPYRTLDGEEADYYYVPLVLRNRNEAKEALVNWVVEYISETWPFYNRKDGADHIFLTNGDWGNCEVSIWGGSDPTLAKSITLTLWGNTRNMWLKNDDKDLLPCFRPGQDIAMPPFLDWNVYQYTPWLKEDSENLPARTVLLYFKGSSARDSPFVGPYTWSFGVRQKMFELYEGKEKETGIRVLEQKGYVEGYLEGMSKAIFCLAPCGWGWGIRATQAASVGCIPVVIQPGVVQPLEKDLLDWSEFSVMLQFDDIPRIADILRAISEEEIQQKREKLAQVWTRFAWTSSQFNPLALLPKETQDKFAPLLAEKDAFASLMEALGRRLERKTEQSGTEQSGTEQSGTEDSRTEQSTTSKCAGNCVHGSCNEEMGECYCLGGYSGPTCEDFAMPSCHLAPNYFTPCYLPTSCGCVAECEAYHFLHETTCYDEKLSDGGVETDIKRLYAGPQAKIQFSSEGKEITRERIRPEDGFGVRYASPEFCTASCSGHGVCNTEIASCECAWAHSGESCSSPGPIPFPCVNLCSNNGQCLDGTCKCNQGFFGIDCSLHMDETGRPKAIERPELSWVKHIPANRGDIRPRIYVYELPGQFNTWQFQQGPYQNYNMEAPYFLERLLASPHRTANPEEADYFYLPLFLRSRKYQARATLKAAVEYVKEKWPYWNKNGGKNHIVFASSRWGKCDLSIKGEGEQFLTSMIFITLWGMTKSMWLEEGKLPCFTYGHDIVAPPIPQQVLEANVHLKESSQIEADRPILLLLQANKEGVSPEEGGVSIYSFGVVQRMFELYEGREKETGIRVVSTFEGDIVVEEMERAIFCLASTGEGWTMLAAQAVIMGCIPVVIQPDVVQPLEGEILDWSQFSVRLQAADIPRIAQILRQISKVEIQNKRRALSEVWPRFVWASEHLNPLQHLPDDESRRTWGKKLQGEDAFSSIITILKERLEGFEESPRLPEGVRSNFAVESDNLEGGLSKLPSTCPEGCWEHGTCNEDLGRCECPINRAGPTCQNWAMPSCHVLKGFPEAFLPCMLAGPCDCLAECAKHLLQYTHTYTAVFEQACYNERREDGSNETDPHKLYAGPQAMLTFNREFEEESRRALPSDSGLKKEWASPDECPDSCNGRGACQNAGGENVCHCPWTYGGRSCEQRGAVAIVCFNGCSGRGTCLGGACKCDRGFFGIDCALYKDAEGRTRVLRRAPFPWVESLPAPSPGLIFRPKVYVYEIPQYLNTWQYQHEPWMDWPEQIYFLERLLSSGYRTANPEEADYFFIPLMHRNRGGIKMQTIVRAVEYVKNTWPKFWNRYKGRDHIIVDNGDWGICELGPYGQAEPFFDQMIVITLWGHTRNMHLQRTQPCFRPGKDIVMPPVMVDAVYENSPHLKENSEAKERTILLYFKGWDAIGSNPFGPYHWSFGVRQKMFELYAGRENVTGIRLEGTVQFTYVDNFIEQMTRSIFCLAPSGWGWGMRTTQAVILGCIPVVIQPSVVQPLEGELLNWEEFAVVLKFEDIPNIENILRSISPDIIAKKREIGAQIWTRFVWSSPSVNPLIAHSREVQEMWAPILAEKDAVASVMEILARRLKTRNSPTTWLGGASLENLKGIKFASDLFSDFKQAVSSILGGPETDSNLKNLAEEETSATLPAEKIDLIPSACPEGCWDHGTCNEEMGRCECKGGYKGPTCEELALPSCHLAPNYYTPCGYLSTCGCTLECESYRFRKENFCLNERRADGTNETDIVKLFAAPQVFLFTDGEGKEIGPRRELPKEKWKNEFTSPTECENSCSGHGLCTAKDKHCLCAWMHGGRDCSQYGDIPVKCFNECSDRGECLDGVCKCRRPYFGIDCSLSIGADGRTEIMRRPPFPWSDAVPAPSADEKPRPRVYVYELPGYFNSWQFQHSFYLDWQEPVYFLERLLASPHRTADPKEADYFYIPLILRNRNGPATLLWALDYVQQTWPFWNASMGRDHIVMTNGDWGNCEIGEYGVGEPLLDGVVTFTLWGHTKNMRLKMDQPCFRKGKDVVMPPRMVPDVFWHVPMLKRMFIKHVNNSKEKVLVNEWGPKLEIPKRKTLLFFKGYPALDSTVGPFTWSFGVRQEMFKLYANRENETGIRLLSTEGMVWGYLEEMERSIFCLAPSGWGWGMRATQAAIVGCIPVVIQPGVVQPLEHDLLDWEEFGIRLEFEDIPRIEQILRAIPEDVIQKKRAACQKVWTRFTWASFSLNPLKEYPQEIRDKVAPSLASSDAFSSLMQALGNRLIKKGKIKS